MRKALVTGADGFIGKNLIVELLNNNYLVFAAVRNKNSAENILGKTNNLRIIECEMKDYARLQYYQDLIDCDMVFHLAWSGVSNSLSTDYSVQLDNVRYACDLQAVCAKLKIKRLIFADSIMEYEHKKAVEEGFYNLSLRNTYHIAKTTTKEMLQLRCFNTGMEFVSMIISNVYGIGENSPRLINTTIRNLLKHQHMSFTSGEQKYDFIYISDAVKAIRIAAENGKNYKSYYIGNRAQRPLKEFLYIMRDIIAPDMYLGIGELEFKGVSLEYNEFDTDGIYREFNFKPEVEFKQGIWMTANWIKSLDSNLNYND